MASGAYTHTHTHTRIHLRMKVIIRNQVRRPVAGAPGLKIKPFFHFPPLIFNVVYPVALAIVGS